MKRKRFWKKNIGGIIVALICLIAPFAYRMYMENNYQTPSWNANISKHEAIIDVEEDGSIYFHETITLNTRWSAIFKDIYYGRNLANTYSALFPTGFDKNSVSVSVELADGTKVFDNESSSITENNRRLGFQWNNDKDELGESVVCEYNAPNCQSIFIYNRSGFGKNTRITYNYRIEKAAVKFSDITELNWVFATTNGMPSKNMEVTINLPQPAGYNLAHDDVYVYGHEASHGKIDFPEDRPYQIKLSADKLLPNEKLEARILYPNALSSNIPSSNISGEAHLERALNIESDLLKENNMYIAIDYVGIAFIILGVTLVVIFLIKVYRKYDKEYKSDFDLDIYRELPADYGPAVMGYLYRYKEITKNDVSATLMDLIRRGFITIDAEGQSLTNKNVNYSLIYNVEKDQSELKEHERYLLTWFFEVVAGGSILTLNQLEAFTKTETNAIKYMNCDRKWCDMLRTASEKEHFFEAKTESAKMKSFPVLISLAFVIVSALCLLMPVVSFIYGLGIFAALLFFSSSYTYSILRRSHTGNEDYVRWHAFKNFLCEFSNIKDYPMPGIIVWEHYMVYATAFGVAELVEKQLKFKFKELHMEDQMYNSTFFHYPVFYIYFNTRVTHSFTNARKTISTARAQRVRASASRGGRGGFGGGSSFGGGGSGMRGR